MENVLPPTRDAILAAAIRQFIRSGYRRCSVSAIAEDAGVAKASLYNHFRGKQDIYEAALARYQDQLVQRAHDAASKPGPLADRIRGILLAKFGRLALDRYQASTMNEFFDASPDQVAAGVARFEQVLVDALEGEVADPEGAAVLLHRCARGMSLPDPGGRIPTPDVLATRLEALVPVLLAGLDR